MNSCKGVVTFEEGYLFLGFSSFAFRLFETRFEWFVGVGDEGIGHLIDREDLMGIGFTDEVDEVFVVVVWIGEKESIMIIVDEL